MAEPRVSVLITAYEHERYIARALDGVLEQRDVAYGERRRLTLWLSLRTPPAITRRVAA